MSSEKIQTWLVVDKEPCLSAHQHQHQTFVPVNWWRYMRWRHPAITLISEYQNICIKHLHFLQNAMDVSSVLFPRINNHYGSIVFSFAVWWNKDVMTSGDWGRGKGTNYNIVIMVVRRTEYTVVWWSDVHWLYAASVLIIHLHSIYT